MDLNGTSLESSPGRSGMANRGCPVRRVLVVDGHPLVRLGVRQVLDDQADLCVCGEAETVRDARIAIRDLKPDVIIMDISLKGGDGFELVREVRAHYPGLPILVLSMHDESIYAERMLAAGVNGFITKHAGSEQFLASLRCVLGGKVYVSEFVSSNMIRKFAAGGSYISADPVERLSNRELQILRMIGKGISTRESALLLNLSIKTVESHRQRIKRKLNLMSGTQLLQYAVSWVNRESDSDRSSQPSMTSPAAACG